MHFCRGTSLFFSSIPQGMGNTKAPTWKKRWEQCSTFRISWKFKPQGLSQTARSNGGTIRRAQEIFLPARADSPVIHRRIFTKGSPIFSPNPAGNGKYKTPTSFAKGGSSVLKCRKRRGSRKKRKLERDWEEHPALCRNRREMRKLKCMPPPAFRATLSFPPVKTSCFIGVQCVY